ncbi:MAG: hypothetical protein ISS92_05295, partial [Candidatus Omnitrophica bacterium]|nr:hypothetical protein [Candidatus Omnitrophota bacterium]
RLLTENEPVVYNVYEPPAVPEIGAYVTNNPVIQPVLGVFYTDENIMEFQEISNKPFGTEIKYQVSNNGYMWYWYNGSSWALVTGGYSQANTADEVNTNLDAFQNLFTEGDFYYRAYLHSDPGALKTPSLDNIGVTLVTGETYYVDPNGATAINSILSDADNDQWFQYKAILYSEGEDTAILDDVNVEYIKAYVTVTAPNGGESIPVGSAYYIGWDSQAITKTNGLVKLEYSIDGGSIYETIEENVSNIGVYEWAVPDDPSQDAFIKITSEDFPVVSDISDAAFRILSLEVTSPNGGEVWEQGKSHNITWSSTGAISNNVVKIEYSTDGGSEWTTIVGTTGDDGTHPWSIPQEASDQVLVRISSPSNSDIVDTSDAVFSVVPLPAISISSPAGGETWNVGTSQTISWRANQLQFSDEVILEYSTDNFVADINDITQVSIGTPEGGNPNDDIIGSYDWTIPDNVSGGVKIRIKEESIPAGRDTQQIITVTSSAFSIVEPTITVTSPAMGDVWVVGDTHDITWTTEGTVSDNLLLEYSTDGTNYTEIATGEANDGTYSWVILAGATGGSVSIRITDNDRTQVEGTSDPFEVLAYATITVTQPNGGEELTIGTDYEIKWSTYGQKLESGGEDYNVINIYYSTNNGSNWEIIAFHTSNTGSYTWEVDDAESSQALIKITDDNQSDVVLDTSDAVFSIVPPTITIISPNGGEVFYATGNYNITWSSVGTVSNNLTLEYSTNSGGSWTGIATGETNDGTYLWSSIADVDTQGALIRITDASRSAVTDVSNSTFTITPPTITVGFPNGGEEFAVGTAQDVTWTSIGYDYGAIDDNLTIQYSSNGGGDWTDVATGEANDGTYAWTVPEAISNTCLLKIFDASRTATSDTSDANFKIILPYVRVLTPNGGEQWPIGTEQGITWSSLGSVSDNLTIEYSKDNFSTSTLIATGEADDNSYTWTIPDDYSTTVKVRITDASRSEIYDTSDVAFAIVNPILTITYPNGGQLLTVGDTETITWTNTGSVGNDLLFEYSKDNFATAGILIEDNVTNTENYDWTIPNDVSTTVRVRITDNTRSGVSDKSDSNFTILPTPVITVVAPNGGEVWKVGTEQEITWSDNGGLISNNLTLRYSTDGGAGWPDEKIIATSQANDGSYTWTIADDVSDNCMVKIIDANRETTFDVSDLKFEIAVPTITITSPNGGEIWAVGDRAPVAWTTEGSVSNNLILEYSDDGGSNYNLVESGVSNSGSYTWTVPDNITSNAIFKIYDGDRAATVDVSDAVFTINPMPTINITNPDGGEIYVLNEEVEVTWEWTGLSISDNLVIDYSNDNFSTRRIIAQGVANSGKYYWTIPEDALAGSTVKLRIIDGDRTEITDKSDGYFRIRGGFTITSPNGAEEWGAKAPMDITWDTRGIIPRIKLEYCFNGDQPEGDRTWTTITADTVNEEFYTWTVPDVKKDNCCLIRVSDPDDPTVMDESDSTFSIIYFTVTWKLLDYDTYGHLAQLNVNEPATGWIVNDASLTSAITREYTYGNITTFWTKEEYLDVSKTWTANSDLMIITMYMESKISAQVEWHVLVSPVYTAGTDTLKVSAWLERRGKLVGVRDIDLVEMKEANLEIYDSGALIKTLNADSPNDKGVYEFTWASTGLEGGKSYFIKAIISFRQGEYISGVGFDVTRAKELLNQKTELATLQEKATDIKTAVTTTIPDKVDDAKEEIKSDTAAILADTGIDIPAAIEDAKAKVETSMKTEILNRESILRTGQEIVLRYRTHSGLGTVTFDIYNPKKKLKKQAVTMTEIGTTGIYEKAVTFLNAWGEGDFTVVCSDTTYGTMDALTITVVGSDIDSVAGNVAAIMGTTSGLSDVADIAETLNSQFAIIERSLKNVGVDIVSDVEDAVRAASEMENVFNELAKVSKSIKKMEVASEGLDLNKFYDLEEGKKEDMTYLKNKTQELKAMMGLSQKMIDNVANEPIVQTWYEYRSVVLKAIIINPSATQTKTVPFKIYLPKETKPEHIISRGELKVGYDTQQGSYYVHAQFRLKPKETKEVDIELKDIWQIKPFEIESLRRDAKKVYNILRDTEFNERAKFLLTSIEESLDAVIEKQKDKPVNPEDHISGYRENLEMIQECKADLSLLRSLLSQAKPINIKATWKLIVAIVIFLGLLSTGFYIMWQKQIKLSEVPSIDSGEKKPEEKK